MATEEKMTVGQLEREVSQKLQALYKANLGHQPGKITCQLFGAKLAIVVEDSLTQPEQLLAKEGQLDMAKKIRDDLDDAMQPKIKELLAQLLKVDVLDLLSDATFDTGRIGIIAVLAEAPSVRNPEALPKLKPSA